MTRPPPFRSANLARALKVMQQAGLTVSRVEIAPDGALTIACGGDGRDLAREDARRSLEELRARLRTEPVRPTKRANARQRPPNES